MMMARSLRTLRDTLVAAALVLVVVTTCAAWVVWRGISRIQMAIDPQGVARAINAMVIESIKQGDIETKLQVIQYLGDAGPASQEFVPVLLGVTEDEDQDDAVRRAATETLNKIAPTRREL